MPPQQSNRQSNSRMTLDLNKTTTTIISGRVDNIIMSAPFYIPSTTTAITSNSGRRSSIKNLDAGTSLMIAANIKKAASRRRGSNCSSNAGKGPFNNYVDKKRGRVGSAKSPRLSTQGRGERGSTWTKI